MGPGTSPLNPYATNEWPRMVRRTIVAVRSSVSPDLRLTGAIGFAAGRVARSMSPPGRNAVTGGVNPTSPGIMTIPRGMGIGIDGPMPGMLAIPVSGFWAATPRPPVSMATTTRIRLTSLPRRAAEKGMREECLHPPRRRGAVEDRGTTMRHRLRTRLGGDHQQELVVLGDADRR